MLSATTLKFSGAGVEQEATKPTRGSIINEVTVKVVFGMGTRVKGLDMAPSADQRQLLVASIAPDCKV
jgi:hypothetical protein